MGTEDINLPPFETHVWYTQPDQIDHEQELSLIYSVLSSQEQARYWRFFNPKVRTEFCAAHSLLRIALSQYHQVLPSEWQFTYDANGRPFITWPQELNLHFSLTHTSTLVACAISAQKLIGIDVEDTERSVSHQDIAERIFSKQELEEFAAVSPPSKGHFFFTIWTLKEAFTKAMGLGLSMPVQQISFHVEPGRVLFDHHQDLQVPSEWHFDIHDVGSHRMAVAQAGTGLVIKYHPLDLTKFCPLL